METLGNEVENQDHEQQSPITKLQQDIVRNLLCATSGVYAGDQLKLLLMPSKSKSSVRRAPSIQMSHLNNREPEQRTLLVALGSQRRVFSQHVLLHVPLVWPLRSSADLALARLRRSTIRETLQSALQHRVRG